MAIEFARVRYIKRTDGGNACRSSAYNARTDLPCERTGERFYFAHRDPVLHHDVLLPEGASERFKDVATLWNEAQAMERRKDSQEARELLLALPSDAGLGPEDWKALAEEFAREHFVSKGLAVQLDIHPPHEGEINVHAHLLITTRRIIGDAFDAHKARDLDPEMRTMKGGQKAVTEADRWGVLWRDAQNRYFEREGLDIRVDEIGAYAQRHEGPVRMRTRPKDAEARAQANREANEAAARDPEQIIAALTQRRATFTALDIERHIKKHVSTPLERAEIRTAVLSRPEVVALHDHADGSFTGRFTTRGVREEEKQVMAAAAKIAHARKAVDGSRSRVVAEEMSLDTEQRAAFLRATGTDGLVVIEGLACTGKSHTLNGIREAHERAGWRVIGLAPTNTAAEGLRQLGFREGSTVHLELFNQANAHRQRFSAPWNRRTLVILDEAAMLDTRTTKRLMDRAAETGAKVIIAGDDRQLASMERGGMFTAIKENYGSAKITKVRRQDTDWQRQASEDFSEGRVAEGLRAYAEHGHVHWSGTVNESRDRLLSDWDMDSRERPDTNRFVYAGTNKQVNQLNLDLRGIRQRRGEIGDELEVETVRGKLKLGAGDRIQFHGNDRKAGIYNGTLATIDRIERGWIRARTDAGRDVVFDSGSFKEFGLGYAGTVYRGQGKTQTDVYALYDNVFAWNARTAYVGMTRHKARVELYVSKDLASNEIMLGRLMAQKFREEASLAWATRDEVREQRQSRETEGQGTAEKPRAQVIAEPREAGDDKDVTPPAQTAPETPTPAKREPFPREQVDALRRLDLTEYARDVHGYAVHPNPFGVADRYELRRPDGKGGEEMLEVRRATDGHWTFRNPANRYQRGDIFDLAKREGAPDLETARHDVAAYWQSRAEGRDISRGERARYDVLRAEQQKNLDKDNGDKGRGDTDDGSLSFSRDRNPDKDRGRDR
jgi:Ti-type conjugative transfer relaxase TraA